MATTQQSLFQGPGDGVSVIPRKATRSPGRLGGEGPLAFSLSLPPLVFLLTLTSLLAPPSLPAPASFMPRPCPGSDAQSLSPGPQQVPLVALPLRTLFPHPPKWYSRWCFSSTVISPPLPREVPAPELLPRPPAGWQVPDGQALLWEGCVQAQSTCRKPCDVGGARSPQTAHLSQLRHLCFNHTYLCYFYKSLQTLLLPALRLEYLLLCLFFQTLSVLRCGPS